jgi:uroporphyrinogen decarboxylase
MDCISLEHFKEFAHPYTKRFFAEIKQAGAKGINFHTCGRWDDRFDLCCENADILHVDRVDIGDFKQKYGQRVVPMGNVKAVATLLQSTTEEVRNEARACVEAAAAGGAYILSADCAVPRDTPPQNVRVMADVIKEMGAYS